MKSNTFKSFISASMVAGLAASPIASADGLFASDTVSGQVPAKQVQKSCGAGKCGAGKCGSKDGEHACGEGKCGAKDDAKKDGEHACGEGKCGSHAA